MCTNDATISTRIFSIPQFCGFFGISNESFHPNQSHVSLCSDHYYKHYHHINSCKLCSGRLLQGTKRRIPPENHISILSYWGTLYPEEKVTLTKDDDVCSDCYFLSRALTKSDTCKSISTDEGLLSIIDKCKQPGQDIASLDACVIFVAEKLINNEPVLFPSVFDFYLLNSASKLTDHDNKINDEDSETNSLRQSRWLLSSITTALSDHIDFHRVPSRKLGIMIHRKGSDILSALHYTLYQNRLSEKHSSENNVLCNLRISLSDEALLFKAAIILNNVLLERAHDETLMPSKTYIDISKLSLANLIADTDSKLWNFVYLLTMNKSTREKVEKECGINWSSHLGDSGNSQSLGQRTSKILMVISLCLVLCNDNSNLMQLLLSDIIAGFSGSTELNRIFNQLGITVSECSIKRYINVVVKSLTDDDMKTAFVPDGFIITSVDNVDKGSPHASLSFGSTKHGLHGTSVQALQPKPCSIKYKSDDYVMFHRQSSANSLSETANSLCKIPVYPDGRCLFRSVATRLDQRLLLCRRNIGGAPVDPRLFETEKKLADLLRQETVSVLKGNLTFFEQLDPVVLHSLCEKGTGCYYLSFLDRLENMLKFDEYAGAPEILGLVYGAYCPIYIYHETNGE